MALISATCMERGRSVSGGKSTELRCGLKVKSYFAGALGRPTPAFSASWTMSEMVVSSWSLNAALSMLVNVATGAKNLRLCSRKAASFFCSCLAFSMFSWFGCGSRLTRFFSSSVCAVNWPLTSSTACFLVKRKKRANPSRPNATEPPVTRKRFFLSQSMSELHWVLQFQRDAETERHRVGFIHRFDGAGKLRVLVVEQGTFPERILDGVGQLVVGGGVESFQVQTPAFDIDHRDLVGGGLRLGRRRGRGRRGGLAFRWRGAASGNQSITFRQQPV